MSLLMQPWLEEMEKLNRIGEVIFRGEYVEWTISNFYVSSKGDYSLFYESPAFTYFDTLWKLNLRRITNGRIEVALVKGLSSPTAVKVTLSIRKMDGTEQIVCKEKRLTFFTDSHDEKYLGRGEILKRQSICDPYSGPLTVTFTLSRDEHQSLQDSLLERLMNLSRSMNNILSQGEDTDIVLKLKTREIRAHRVILKSRSTYFKNMLDSDMRENRTGVIDLVDDDEDAFDIVLSYIYCGRVEKLDYKNACEVFKIADKYDLQELKKLCSVFMTENMCMYLVCDVFALSKLYEEARLNRLAKDYFTKNATEIIKTEEWMAFKRDKPELATELSEWSSQAATKRSLDEEQKTSARIRERKRLNGMYRTIPAHGYSSVTVFGPLFEENSSFDESE